MGTRPNENWEARTIDSRSPKFRIDVANPEMGAEGADVYKIYAVTDNKDVNLCSLSEGGKYKIHNDKSLEIVAGMTNTEGAVDIVIALAVAAGDLAVAVGVISCCCCWFCF